MMMLESDMAWIVIDPDLFLTKTPDVQANAVATLLTRQNAAKVTNPSPCMWGAG